MSVRRLLAIPLIPVMLAILIAAEPRAPLTGSRVTLDARQRKLAEAAAEIARQANVPIDVSRVSGDKPVRLQLDKTPFWEAVDRLARAADLRVRISAQGNRVSFEPGPYSVVPTSVTGPFCFIARRIVGRLDFESGVTHHEVQIDLAWEPTFKVFYTELDPQSVKAIGSDGKSLTVINEGATRVPVTDATPQLTIKFRGIPRSEKTIAQIDGAAKFLGTSEMLQFAVDLDATQAPMRRAEVTAKLESFKSNVRLWSAVVELQYPRDMPEFESFQSFLLDNQAWLLRSDGVKFPIKDFELGFQEHGKVPIHYYIRENEKTGPVIGDRKGWKLVIRVPGRIVEERVPFQLKNVRLP
jgi:hypothetical protein